MSNTEKQWKAFLNEQVFPLWIRFLGSTMLLEFSREHIVPLDEDRMYCHPQVQCTCGSDKVFNYGIPKNNGKYFFCRTCGNSFTLEE